MVFCNHVFLVFMEFSSRLFSCKKNCFQSILFFAILENGAILIKYLIIFGNSVDVALACKLLRKYGFLCL